MKRRDFVRKAGAGVGAAALGTVAAPAIASGSRQLKMVTTWPKNFPGLGTGAQRVADTITAMTGGKLSVRLYAAGEIVAPFESFDAVSKGAADMYHGADYYWQGKSKAFNFFCTVPFGLTAPEMDAWLNFAGGQALWDELAAGFGIKPFAAGNTGVQMGGWFNKEINTPEDYKGLKIRMPGLGGEVLRQLGASAVSLPGGEIFPALQSGAIDATEWVGPWNDLAFGFYKVTKYYYYPGFHEPGTTLSLGMNKQVWESLSSEEQAIVRHACLAETNLSFSEFNTRNGDALDTLKKKHSVKVRKFDDSILARVGEASAEVVANAGTTDAISKKVYESFSKFRTKSMAWSALAGQAFWNARSLPVKG
jgi:TRAP-type mannitol/chloroaromatic compound transport system substrate-binding protein